MPTPANDQSFVGNANYLELVATCIAILVWAPKLKGSMIIIESDNLSTVPFLHRGRSTSLPAICWLKRVFYSSLQYDYHVSARHYPSSQNALADALSRLAGGPVQHRRFIDSLAHPLTTQILSDCNS